MKAHHDIQAQANVTQRIEATLNDIGSLLQGPAKCCEEYEEMSQRRPGCPSPVYGIGRSCHTGHDYTRSRSGRDNEVGDGERDVRHERVRGRGTGRRHLRCHMDHICSDDIEIGSSSGGNSCARKLGDVLTESSLPSEYAPPDYDSLFSSSMSARRNVRSHLFRVYHYR